MSAEFSRRVDVEVFKDEPLTFDEWVIRGEHLVIDRAQTEAEVEAKYQDYLEHFQPYWWHAQSPNGEILTNGEHYLHEDGALNSIEVLLGDDTTMYYARTYGEDLGIKWLRYGKTDRDHQAAQQ